MSARDTSIKKRDNTEVRIAEALERIAGALEQANAVRIWPTLQPVGGAGAGVAINGWSCPTCGGWILSGTFHSCGGSVR